MKVQLDNLNATRAIFKALANQGRFSAELNERIKADDFSIRPISHFVTKDISGKSGTIDILDAQTKKIDGVSTISENTLPRNEGHLSSMIGVSLAKGTKAGDSKFNQNFPAGLENATLQIIQRGNVIVERPMSDLIAEATSDDPRDQVVDLGIPFSLRDAEETKIKIAFPADSEMTAAADADNNWFFKIKTWGYSTAPKS
ncbi:hypothetical protein [Mesonia aquimarina]|uniref:hypothetical protein n=1 Tax=Mesonia aquimarina TaxID=1504967 RepID=UPI000EF61686|nr:hypothetical protein [Mesonia aquimarina]